MEKNIELGEKREEHANLCGIYTYEEVPDFLQGNVWILRGYRVNLSHTQCMRSLFMWSNESLNIWSHLIGGLLFLLFVIYDNCVAIPALNGKPKDHFIITTLDICSASCLLLSAGFHTFCCHSILSYQRWLALDLAGISLSLVGMYIASFFYGFFCHWVWQYFYTCLVSIFLVICTYLHTKPKFLAPEFYTKRVTLYSCLVLFGIIPASHWFVMLGGWASPAVQVFLPKLVVMYVLACLGLSLYVTKIPERLFPGILIGRVLHDRKAAQCLGHVSWKLLPLQWPSMGTVPTVVLLYFYPFGMLKISFLIVWKYS